MEAQGELKKPLGSEVKCLHKEVNENIHVRENSLFPPLGGH